MKRFSLLIAAAVLLTGVVANAGAQSPYYTTKIDPSLTVKAKPKRDRKAPFKYTVSGTLKLNGAEESACEGRVRVRLTRGSKTVVKKNTTVKSNCKYSRKVTAKKSLLRKAPRSGKLKVTARFFGNGVLNQALAGPKTVRYR